MDPNAALDPFAYALEAIPTDDPRPRRSSPTATTTTRTCRAGPIVFTGDLLKLKVGDHTFDCLWTPGHTPGQLAVHVPEERVVFTGDTIFSGVQTWLMTSNVDQWIEALERIRALDVDYVVPGHGPVVELDVRADAAGASCWPGRPRSPTRSRRAGRARRRSPGSGSTTRSARSTSGRAT